MRAEEIQIVQRISRFRCAFEKEKLPEHNQKLTRIASERGAFSKKVKLLSHSVAAKIKGHAQQRRRASHERGKLVRKKKRAQLY